MSQTKELVSNKKAHFHYEILERIEVGVVFSGTEVKSLRDRSGSLQEAYVKMDKGALFLVGCSIPPYKFGNIHNHEERRERKLLLHKNEISRLKKSIQEKGLTIIPLSLYLKNGLIKLEIAVARGKKKHDKRETIKERDVKRDIDRAMKQG
jgi:SsrA-binding protein